MAPKSLASQELPNVSHPLLTGAKAKVAAHTQRLLPSFTQTKALSQQPPAPPGVIAMSGPRQQAQKAIAAASSRQAHVLSRNWAGAIVPATGSKRFSLITGRWTVPDVGETNNTPDSYSYISIWIGLGGSYQASRSMPQMGTEHGWEGPNKVHRLWCQWWLGRDNSAGYLSYRIDETAETKLDPGDTVTCWLEVDPSGSRVTYHWRVTSKDGQSTKDFGAEDALPVPVMADSANWIVERPTEVIQTAANPPEYELGRHHRLPDLYEDDTQLLSGKVTIMMEDCIARLGPAGLDEFIRQPVDGQLLSLQSFVLGKSRSFVELEPAVPIDRGDNRLAIVRHLL